MKFILKFYSSFVFLTMICYVIFDRTNEMLGYIVWFLGLMILYSPVLFIIYRYINEIKVYWFLIKFFLSLLFLNILLYILYHKNLFLIIMHHEWNRTDFLISLMLYLIFTLSYVIASLPFPPSWRTPAKCEHKY